jgi:tetratricopeptide (TPR) repeat protein
MRLAVLAIFCASVSYAQNIEASRYPQYRAELEAYQAAFKPSTAEKAELIARGGLADAQAKQDRDAAAHWLRLIGASFEVRNDLKTARSSYEQSLDLRRELKQRPDILILTNGIGYACFRMRDYAMALKYVPRH